MFSAPLASRQAQAYRTVDAHTAVDAAQPARLIVLLFDALCAAIATAEGAMQRSDVQAKCQAIARALRLIDEGLAPAVDLQRGGALARDLRELYHFATVRLMQANLRNDAHALAECRAVIEPLRSAWRDLAARHGGR